MEKGHSSSGLFIMLGLIFLGCMIPKAVNDYKGYERVVSVKGLCEREVKADKVIWPLVVRVGGNDIGQVSADLERKNQRIRQFLLAGGIQESEISLSATSVSDTDTESYRQDRVNRYIAKCVTTVCSQDIEKVRSLIARQNELMEYGIIFNDDWENRTIYSFEGLNELKPSMIEEATRNAREVAQKFANDSGSTLGKIKDASQGSFSINDRDENTPWLKTVRVVTSVAYYLKK